MKNEAGQVVPEQSLRVVEQLLREVIARAGFHLDFALEENPQEQPRWRAEFTGDDVPLLLARRAELLFALEHIAAKVLGLSAEEHDEIGFDAGGFRIQRAHLLMQAAQTAEKAVRTSGRPHRFHPMSSRERRTLHLLLAPTGLRTASEGEGPGRHLVVYPPAR